jgi:hypothetical protein
MEGWFNICKTLMQYSKLTEAKKKAQYVEKASTRFNILSG